MQYKLVIKHEEVQVFHKIVRLMRKKQHLTVEGLLEIEEFSQVLKDLKRVA